MSNSRIANKDAILRNADIAAVISRYMPLHPKGSLLVGACPWHDSASGESFHVREDHQDWRCWGCAIGGDALAFIARYHRLDPRADFVEALELLAADTGQTVQYEQSRSGAPDTPAGPARADLYAAVAAAVEWYRTGGDYMTALADTQNLFSNVWKQAEPAPINFSNPWEIICVADVFEEFAGWNPVENFDADRFDFDLVEKVEPALAKDRPVVLKDYPAELCALARLKPGNPKVAERWELYLNGIEIANAYSELTDPAEQRARFEKWAGQRRALGKTVYPIDEEFIQCLENVPPSGGCALGIDRLLMALIGTETLDDILPFRD